MVSSPTFKKIDAIGNLIQTLSSRLSNSKSDTFVPKLTANESLCEFSESKDNPRSPVGRETIDVFIVFPVVVFTVWVNSTCLCRMMTVVFPSNVSSLLSCRIYRWNNFDRVIRFGRINRSMMIAGIMSGIHLVIRNQ